MVLVAAIQPFVLAGERRHASQPAAAKTGEATNIMWRCDGNGRYPNIHPPAEWKSDLNILWKTPVDIGGYSSPIVVKDKVFVTAEMGSLICLNLSDGGILWQKDLFSEESADIPADLSKELMRGCGGDSKQSTPTPTSNGELVFYINAMGLCACYDLQGNCKWIQIVETAEEEEYFSASPIFAGDRIVLSWGCLLALSAKDGHTLWKAADALPTHGTPAITKIGDVEVAITPAGDIVSLADGEILCGGLFESTYVTPLVEDNVLYMIDDEALALELPAKAEPRMRLKELWKSEFGGEFMASPIYKNGLIYTNDTKCRLYIIDAKTGEVLSVTRQVDKKSLAEKFEPGVKIEGLASARFAYASPVATERNLFLFDDAGNAAVLGLGRKYQLIRVNQLADVLVGTPYFVDHKIIIRGNKTVYCLGEKH